jgi:hypothetical protein
MKFFLRVEAGLSAKQKETFQEAIRLSNLLGIIIEFEWEDTIYCAENGKCGPSRYI